MAVGETLLECRNVDARYGRIQVCRDISFTVQRGEILTVLGPNGAGKSSLLGAISGIVSGKGSITLNGESIETFSAEKRARHGVRLVPEGRGLFPGLTVAENLTLGARLAPKEQRESLMARALELFPVLGDRTKQAAGNLSGGEQQMLAIGKTISGAPSVVLLDEPTQGLAPGLFETLRSALLALRDDGLSVLLVEQRHAFARSVSDRTVVLVGGKLVYQGDAGEELGREKLMQVYTEAGAAV